MSRRADLDASNDDGDLAAMCDALALAVGAAAVELHLPPRAGGRPVRVAAASSTTKAPRRRSADVTAAVELDDGRHGVLRVRPGGRPLDARARALVDRFAGWMRLALERAAVAGAVHDVAHDLGNMLSPLLARLFVARQRGLVDGRGSDRTVASELDEAARIGDRLMRMLTAFLDAARLEHGAVALHREEVDLAALAREAVALLGAARAVITIVAPREVRAQVDRSRVRDAVAALVSLALDRAADGAVTVDVSPPAIVTVTGAAYLRADGTASDAPLLVASPGLATWLARGIARAHGGRLTLAATSDGAFRAHLTLTAAPPPSGRPRSGARTTRPRAGAARGARTRRARTR